MSQNNKKNEKKTKTIEEIYKKLTPIQHVLEKGGMWVGSSDLTKKDMWTFDEEKKKILKKEIEFVPAMFKIYDEVVVNAIDHVNRDKDCNEIKININQDTNVITCYNNGSGIPVVIHKEHNIYVPELIFGNLMSGSNFDENNEGDPHEISGTFGLGCKLGNIYSKRFEIDTIDAINKFSYIQEFSNNMSIIKPPVIKKSTAKPYTKISFEPDLKRFNLEKIKTGSSSDESNQQIISILNQISQNTGQTARYAKSFSDYVSHLMSKPTNATTQTKLIHQK